MIELSNFHFDQLAAAALRLLARQPVVFENGSVLRAASLSDCARVGYAIRGEDGGYRITPEGLMAEKPRRMR